MAVFKDTKGVLRLDYFEKMVEAETMFEMHKRAGKSLEADRFRKEAVMYASLLTAISTALLTK